MTFKSGFKSNASGFEILSSSFGKIHFYNYEIIIGTWKYEFFPGESQERFPRYSKDSGEFCDRWIDRTKAFHTPHVIPHVRFYITAATTSAGQNTNRMHRLLFDTSTSWSSIKFALSKNNCEREYWLCRDYKWPRRGWNARSGDPSRPISSAKNVLWTDFFTACCYRQCKQ